MSRQPRRTRGSSSRMRREWIVDASDICAGRDSGSIDAHARLARVRMFGARKEGEINGQDLVCSLLSANDIRIVLHPQIELATGRIVAAEALARWKHSALGDIPPSRFVPLANECGLNVLLFHCVEAKVVALLRTLIRNNCPIPIAVNVSADTLCAKDLAKRLEQRLRRAGVENSLFKLELTEDVPVKDLLALSAIMGQLRHRGFAVSMDDFGCGMATLDLLTKLPFSELKIDSNFVRNMLDDPVLDKVVRSVIALGRDLGMKVVAEGIESDEHVHTLIEYGCQIGQGYAFCRPLEVEHFIALLNGSHGSKPLRAH